MPRRRNQRMIRIDADPDMSGDKMLNSFINGGTLPWAQPKTVAGVIGESESRAAAKTEIVSAAANPLAQSLPSVRSQRSAFASAGPSGDDEQ